MILEDATCTACGHVEEQLGDEPCSLCGGLKQAHLISYRPTQILDPVMAKVTSKHSLIKQRLQGKLPWRRVSESQSD